MKTTILVNGAEHHLDMDPQTPLLWVLREQLGLTGTKYSCGIGECGACTVLIDGQAQHACTLPVSRVSGKEVVTIEGFQGPLADTLRRAWLAEDVAQCGYCQPGQILSAASLLLHRPDADDHHINTAMAPVLCRCGTYQAIRRAIHIAKEEYCHVTAPICQQSPSLPADKLCGRDGLGAEHRPASPAKPQQTG